jgi:hypothetical protein
VRRFIKSTIGKLIGNIVAVSLIVPYATFFVATTAKAQMVELPSWAVLDFQNLSGKGPANLGAVAADAVRGDFEKTQKYDMVTRDTINRAYASLNLVPPITQKVSLLRLGSELKASTIVTGEIVDWRITKDGSTQRHADVIIQVRVTDVASGLDVNGAAVSAASTVRPNDTADDTLIADALATASAQAINDISSKELPHATVLNTYQESAFINKGSRSGFKSGQQLVVFRGRDQVSSAVVSEVDYDSASIKIVKPIRGVQPGDRVRVIFQIPKAVGFNKEGGMVVQKPKKSGVGGGFLTVVTVLGLITLVLVGNSGGQEAAASVRAEATAEASGGLAAVQLNWSPDMFSKGFDRRQQWQIWRNDWSTTPVLTTAGSSTAVIDTSLVRTPAWADFTTKIPGGFSCDVTAFANDGVVPATGVPGVVTGVPYTYQVSLIYRILGIELPLADETNTWCYFTSSRTSTKGTATPYDQPGLSSPAPNETISGSVTFIFGAAGSALAPGVSIEYIVEVSPNTTFSKKTILSKFVRTDIGGNLTAGPFNLSGLYATSQELYWRVGVRNMADKPGPKPDSLTKERYIFSVPRRMTR